MHCHKYPVDECAKFVNLVKSFEYKDEILVGLKN